VKRFGADGRFLKAYGTPDGRTDGSYYATDFLGLTDIEADAEGGFVVTDRMLEMFKKKEKKK